MDFNLFRPVYPKQLLQEQDNILTGITPPILRTMNKDYVLFLLREAQGHLGEMIQDIKADDGDGFGQFYAMLPLIYRSLNLAWNSTQFPEEDFFAALETEGMPKTLWSFPSDLETFLHD